MVTQETPIIIDVFRKLFVTNISCVVFYANPACRLSFEYPGINVSEYSFVNGNQRVGFNTTSILTLNVSLFTEELTVKCLARCGDFPLMSRSEVLMKPKGI